MIVQRTTTKIRDGQDRDELVELVLAEMAALNERNNEVRPLRVYTSLFSGQPFNMVGLFFPEGGGVHKRDRIDCGRFFRRASTTVRGGQQ